MKGAKRRWADDSPVQDLSVHAVDGHSRISRVIAKTSQQASRLRVHTNVKPDDIARTTFLLTPGGGAIRRALSGVDAANARLSLLMTVTPHNARALHFNDRS
ncbi:hypothetical protein CBOM_04620 [Ceraceosorus bombacis]|uniref:Uncharacterized protein n=1 Tax=Ceraceosorus bombacis TaxID=401625 RepID=A0A0P1BQQ5_9BASI|nr:hypothetical protein CBOM_04620 [Ceraceosorus bombacis]